MKTLKIYEVKTKQGWMKVRAESMVKLNKWAEANNIKNWRVPGIMSRAELNKTYPIVG